MLERTRWITGPLALFDLGLGGIAVLWPDVYASLMHGPLHPDAFALIHRTGVLWLFFSLCEFAAFLRCERWPATILAVAILRLMDVPADTVYFVTSTTLTFLGRSSLLIAPFFNLAVGAYLFSAWKRRPTAAAPGRNRRPESR
ncbi:MAG: hypothetical protein HYT87_13765 [Nitrospirae bacterium]|nr:hypothetical protein [Nitrospirota bacterium]